MREKLKRIEDTLSNIRVHEVSESQWNICALVNSKLVTQLCDDITSIQPYSKSGFNFWFVTLDYEDKLKIILLLEHMAEEDSELVEITCMMTLHLIQEALSVFCEIESDSEETGYLNACEDTIGFYLEREKFDHYHKQAHKLLHIIMEGKELTTRTIPISRN